MITHPYYALRYLEYSDIKTEYFNDLYKWTLRTLIILNKREDTQKNRFIRQARGNTGRFCIYE